MIGPQQVHRYAPLFGQKRVGSGHPYAFTPEQRHTMELLDEVSKLVNRRYDLLSELIKQWEHSDTAVVMTEHVVVTFKRHGTMPCTDTDTEGE